MARARQLEDKLGEVINELAQTTEKNFDLQRRLDRSQQQVRLLKAVLGILEEDLDLKTEHAALYTNLSRNPLWIDLESEIEKDSSNEEEDIKSAPISMPNSPVNSDSTGFCSLPQDVCVQLSSYLTFEDICNLARCSRQWYQTCIKQDLVWKTQYRLRWRSDVNDLNFEEEEPGNFYAQFRERVIVDLNWSQGKSKIISLAAHKGPITALQYDRQHLFTASDDGSIIKWTMNSKRKRSLGHREDVGAIMQQHHLACKEGVPLQSMHFHGHSGPIWCLNFSGHLLASGSYDKCVKIWNRNTGDCLLTLRGHDQWVSSVALKGLMCLSGSWDATLRLYRISTDLKQAQTVRVMRGDHPDDNVHCVKWHPTNHNLFGAARRHRTIELWDCDHGRVVTTFVGHMKEVQCIQVEENTIVSGGGDNFVKIWDQRTGGCVHTFRGHSGSVMTLQHDANKIISGGYDKAVKIFDLRSRKTLHTLFGHSSAVFALQFDQDRLITGSADKRAIVWQFR